jgi:DNA-binding LacI/PurR family transcriptional regulator
VAAGTREKVLAAARSLNYRPNLFARSLKTRRSNILGVAVSALDNQFYPDLVQRLSEAFASVGYRLLLFVTHGIAGPDPLLDELLKYRLDGLILASSTVSSALAKACRDAGVPVVMLNNIDPASDVTSVATTNTVGARLIAAFLLAGGHRRFAYIAGLDSELTSYEREAGFTSQLLTSGAAAPDRAVGQFSFEGAAQATRTLLKRRQRPDAIFCANDHMALATVQIARSEFGLVPGRDLSVVGFDNVPVAQWPLFALTTYSQPIVRIVARTVELICSALEHQHPAEVHARLRGELIVRESARRPTSGIFSSRDGLTAWTPDKPLD